MVIDFSFWLVVFAFVTGVIAGLDRWVWRARREAGGARPEPWYVDYSRSFFPVILLVLVLRSFLYEPFRIPSDSMMPTLIQGDFIFVNKWRYGLRLPVVNWKIVPVGDPQRGDVIVFRKPSEPQVVFIKRLIGVPGDRITVTPAGVLVNGQLAPVQLDGQYRGPKEQVYPFSEVASEQLAGNTHRVMFAGGGVGLLGEWVVPAGHYFFMGDNRNNSHDSRFADVGFVPAANLVGNAVSIWLSFNPDEGPILLWNRMGSRID